MMEAALEENRKSKIENLEEFFRVELVKLGR